MDYVLASMVCCDYTERHGLKVTLRQLLPIPDHLLLLLRKGFKRRLTSNVHYSHHLDRVLNKKLKKGGKQHNTKIKHDK
jgi:hypothetical protein